MQKARRSPHWMWRFHGRRNLLSPTSKLFQILFFLNCFVKTDYLQDHFQSAKTRLLPTKCWGNNKRSRKETKNTKRWGDNRWKERGLIPGQKRKAPGGADVWPNKAFCVLWHKSPRVLTRALPKVGGASGCQEGWGPDWPLTWPLSHEEWADTRCRPAC